MSRSTNLGLSASAFLLIVISMFFALYHRLDLTSMTSMVPGTRVMTITGNNSAVYYLGYDKFCQASASSSAATNGTVAINATTTSLSGTGTQPKGTTPSGLTSSTASGSGTSSSGAASSASSTTLHKRATGADTSSASSTEHSASSASTLATGATSSGSSTAPSGTGSTTSSSVSGTVISSTPTMTCVPLNGMFTALADPGSLKSNATATFPIADATLVDGLTASGAPIAAMTNAKFTYEFLASFAFYIIALITATGLGIAVCRSDDPQPHPQFFEEKLYRESKRLLWLSIISGLALIGELLTLGAMLKGYNDLFKAIKASAVAANATAKDDWTGSYLIAVQAVLIALGLICVIGLCISGGRAYTGQTKIRKAEARKETMMTENGAYYDQQFQVVQPSQNYPGVNPAVTLGGVRYA